MGDGVGVAILSFIYGLKPPLPLGRPCPSYRIFMPQSPRWEASLRQSLPVMLFGSNNIFSCSKSSGGSLRPGGGKGYSQRGGPETQSGSTHPKCRTRLEALG